MQKQHVDTGSTWTEEEEKAVFDGFTERRGLDSIVQTFPTDRDPESIRMKFGNHVWEDTNGRRGLRGGNKWVKRHWVEYRKNAVVYADAQIRVLRDEEEELQRRLHMVQLRIKSHESRLREVLSLPK